MLNQQPQRSSQEGATDVSLPTRVRPETLAAIAPLVQDALAHLSTNLDALTDGHYFPDRNGSDMELYARVAFPECPDLSPLLKFLSNYSFGDQEGCVLDSTVHREVVNITSWLLAQNYEPIREPLIQALARGTPHPGSGIEPVVQQLLTTPRSEREFYAATVWCVCHSTLPVAHDFHPPWFEGVNDKNRAEALSTAWSLLRTIINEPYRIGSAIQGHLPDRSANTPVVHELLPMLYNGEKADIDAFQNILDVIREGNKGNSRYWLVLSTPAIRFAVTAGLDFPKLSHFFLKIAQGERLIRKEVESLLAEHGNQPSYVTPERSKWSASHFFDDLGPVPTSTLPSRLWPTLIELGRNIFHATEPFTPESHVLRSLLNLASKTTGKGNEQSWLKFFGDHEGKIERLARISDDWAKDEATEILNEQPLRGERLVKHINLTRERLKLLNLDPELLSIVFTNETLQRYETAGSTVEKCLEWARDIPAEKRTGVAQRVLKLPHIIEFIGDTKEALLLVGEISGISLLNERLWVTEIFDPDFRQAEILAFLQRANRDYLETPRLWRAGNGYELRHSELRHRCYSELDDRIEFINCFAPLIAASNLPLEALYARLDDPAFPYFSRDTWLICYLMRFGEKRPQIDPLVLFEKLATEYQAIWGDTYSAVAFHMELLNLEPFASTPDTYEQEVHLFLEVETFKKYHEDLGEAPSHLLYTTYAGHLGSYQEHDPDALRIQKALQRRLRTIRARVADGSLSEEDLDEQGDYALLLAALGVHGFEAAQAESRFSPGFGGLFSSPPRRRIARVLTAPVATVTRTMSSQEVQEGIRKQVEELRECFKLMDYEQDSIKLLERSKEEVAAVLSSRITELSQISGSAEVYARQSLAHLNAMRHDLADAVTVSDFVNACARPTSALGKRLDDVITKRARILGFKTVQEQIPSRMRGWSQDIYDARERLGGCASLVDEVVRYASIDLTPEGRSLWKRIFSVKSLQQEVSRLHRLDLVTRNLGNEVSIDVFKGSDLLADHAGYLCHTCLRGQDVMSRHTSAQFFVFSRGKDEAKRNVGGTFVFTVNTEDGKKAYLIRGFNPTQTTSLQVDIGAFFEAFVDYLGTQARNHGVDYILVPHDSFSGRAQTNRPAVHAYIAEKYYKDGSQVRIKKHEPLNNIVVTHGCKVREL